MLISSVLNILDKRELPSGLANVNRKEKTPEVPAADGVGLSDSSILRKIRSETLEAADIKRPLLPDDPQANRIAAGRNYESYLQTIERLTKKPRVHAIDVFQ